MNTRTIKAHQVCEGHTVTSITTSDWREDVQPVNGQMPTVVSVEYRQAGEGGLPTVYLGLSDDPGSDYCLGPDDEVAVEVTA